MSTWIDGQTKLTIFSWWPVAPPRWPKSSNDLWYLHHNVSDPDIVVSGGPSYYALSIDASVVADKNETRRLFLFFPFLSEIQFFPLFSHNSLLRQGNPAPNGPSQWYKQPDLIIFPIVNFNHLIWQHLMGVGHGERNCKIGISAHCCILFSRLTFSRAKFALYHLVDEHLLSVLRSVI